MVAETILEVEHLEMRFGGLTAVRDLSFRARRGDITAVIGPNGAGKTTVFNCITGFYRPTSGAIRLARDTGVVDLHKLAGHRIARAGVARTFQNIRLFAGMTALENLLVAQHVPLMAATGSVLARQFAVTAGDGGNYDFRPVGAGPLLVVGQFGRGRTAAFASDVAPHWVGGLVDWGDARVKARAPGGEAIEVGNWYAAFFTQLVRWTMGQQISRT